ncbi:hypothetical protein EM20IM_04870 [Candidatus Methylacidiphilum infernorum]|uniref:Uncharacterized protein n=1 Tax=Candidatus Methylacidiphilum infernorum TaxID=511746 RepID=A0ABX7PYD0_9BACT|nr:hypothetical protein [Candidatus Methylacidiphilum infernorum]QSR87653.1 hypothetical protein EM20IM_04870 [Candidatus Methylacidiphilum infernorum]
MNVDRIFCPIHADSPHLLMFHRNVRLGHPVARSCQEPCLTAVFTVSLYVRKEERETHAVGSALQRFIFFKEKREVLESKLCLFGSLAAQTL